MKNPALAQNTLSPSYITPLVELIVLSITTSLFLAIIDMLLFPDYVTSYISIPQRTIGLPLCTWGNLFPIVLVFSALLTGLRQLYFVRPVGAGMAARILSLAVIEIGIVTYSIWLSAYTFSGDSISASPFRMIFILVSAILVTSLFLLFLAVTVYPYFNRWLSKEIGLVCIILAALGGWINQEMHPNEYGPLHTFVAVWSILLSLLGFREIIEWKRLARIFSAWKIGMMTAGAVLLSLAVLVFLASDSMYSWIIWDATGLSRHVTVRMELPGGDKIQNPNRTDEGMNLVLKPNLTSHEILAKQKQRSIATAPHIVLLIVDNVQTDHVGAYGYRQNPTTPNIDALAKTGTLFENAYSSYPQTRYFSCALLMGRYFASFSRHLFPPSYARLSIIRLLKKRRYLSLVRAWFESAMEKDFNPGDYNIDQYFRPLYENHPLADEGLVDWFKLSENERLNTVRAHLSAADKKGVPALIWIHAIRPHWKGKKIQYAASDKFPFGNETTDRYDSAIAAADHWFGRMKEMVEKQRGKREVVWIVGSDHGAGLGRYKGGSGKSLFDVHTRIPLIIAAPGFSPNRVSTPIDTPLDLAATMLDVAGVQIPEVYQGISLLPLMNGTEEADRIIPLGYGTQWIGAVYRNWKLIRRNDATSLFDLSTDKRELINIADKHPRLTRRLLRFAESTSEKRFYGTKAR